MSKYSEAGSNLCEIHIFWDFLWQFKFVNIFSFNMLIYFISVGHGTQIAEMFKPFWRPKYLVNPCGLENQGYYDLIICYRVNLDRVAILDVLIAYTKYC